MYLIKSQYPVYVNLETSCHCEKASDDCQQASREGSNLVFEIEIAASLLLLAMTRVGVVSRFTSRMA